MNRWIGIGNLTRDVELIPAENTSVAKFGIAINERYKGNEKAHFFNVVCFGKTAESCADYIGKGSLVAIEGRLSQNVWADKDTGEKKSSVEIIAENVQFLSKRDEGDDSDNPFS